MSNNPVVNKPTKEKYNEEISKRFPTLLYLDLQPFVHPKKEEIVLPVVKPSFFDKPETQQLVTAFVQQ